MRVGHIHFLLVAVVWFDEVTSADATLKGSIQVTVTVMHLASPMKWAEHIPFLEVCNLHQNSLQTQQIPWRAQRLCGGARAAQLEACSPSRRSPDGCQARSGGQASPGGHEAWRRGLRDTRPGARCCTNCACPAPRQSCWTPAWDREWPFTLRKSTPSLYKLFRTEGYA